MSENALVIYESPDQARADLLRMEASIADVLPATVGDPGRFVRLVAKVVTENPKLLACTRSSLWQAIGEAASLGLEPTGLLGSAYLVPYQRKMLVPNERGALVERKVMVAQLIPGYRGLIDLARRSGQITAIEAGIVRQRDAFEYVPTRQPDPIIHAPFIPDPTLPVEERDRGPIVGTYMLATLVGGHRQAEWMTYDEVMAIRRRSRAADDGPWVTDESEMIRKTVVRRGSKYLPLTTELRRALELDEEAERSAEPPTLTTKLPSATQMLVDRARRARTGQDAQQGSNTGLDPSSEPEQPPASATDAETEEATCDGSSDELGRCALESGHKGAHRNEGGVWPRA